MPLSCLFVTAARRSTLAGWWLGTALLTPSAWALDTAQLEHAIRAEESALNARVGVAVIDTSDGSRWDYRGNERFALNSTHKAFSCAALLHQVDLHRLSLAQPVSIAPSELVTYSPVTEKHVAPETMTLEALCQAAVSVSDNSAANAVTQAIGGPEALTSYMRSIGDDKTRLDRMEPELNSAIPQDERDTTTPVAIVESLRRIVLGDALTPDSRAKLTDWMLGDQVAAALLRAGLPKDWKIADKSGAGGYGSRNIIAVVWPTAHAPVVVGIYITQTVATMQDSNAAIARLGSALSASLRR